MLKEASVFPAGYAINPVLVLLYSTPFSEEYALLSVATFIAVRLLLLEKALLSILVTLLGMVSAPVRLVLEKAYSSIFSTLSGMVMPIRLLQPEKA